ncbi:MAG TPA: hypothetical protein ENJ37_08160 [Deltaproteobacteria bacterium]|nr:hypothetical protein [Deltaproteobacteria bacterium]
MSDTYYNERLALYEGLGSDEKAAAAAGRLWVLDPDSLRFKHGATLGELKIPYHLGSRDEACLQQAVFGLAALLKMRFEPDSGRPPEGGSASEMEPPAKLPPRTYRTDIFIEGSVERAVALEALASAPHVDSAILHNWLAPDGPGRRLIHWTAAVVEKSLRDETRHGTGEETAYITLLAGLKSLKRHKDRLKDFRIKGFSYEKLDLAVGLTCFAAWRHALARLFARLRRDKAPYHSDRAEMLLTTAVVPRAFLSIPPNLVSSSLNPYAINDETVKAIEAFAPETKDIKEWPAVDELAAGLAERIIRKPSLRAVVKNQGEVTRLRALVRRYLFDHDVPGLEVHERLYEIYGDDRHIRNLLADDDLYEGFIDALEGLKPHFAKDRRRVAGITALVDSLRRFKKGFFGRLLSGKQQQALDAAAVVRGYLAYRLDEHVDRYAAPMRLYLTDRRGEFDEKMLVNEYNRGRLYRFSDDDIAVLKTLTVNMEGQLFIDLKDFTKKTLKVKEIAMAEFLRDHFYTPIIEASLRYGGRGGPGSDESQSIRLTNLPGDAAIFSGSVAGLVSLAQDIQKIIRRYREKLQKRLPPVDEEELLDAVHKRFEAKKAGIDERLDAVGKMGDKKEADRERARLRSEMRRLEDAYRDEIEAAITREMEAGLFISYGVKAETLVLKASREFKEPVKVSIGEKINEACRGTNRNPHVRAKLEILIEKERLGAGSRRLKYPFDVYIDRVINFRMPPELDSKIEDLLSGRGGPMDLGAMAKSAARQFYSDLKRLADGASPSSLAHLMLSTDIYNRGQALSEEALKAYINETRGTKFFFRKTVALSQLHEAMRNAYFFPYDPLELCFGIERVEGVEFVEGFLKHGEVTFKGFETTEPTVVYEMLDREGDLFKSIMLYHFKEWYDQALSAEETSSQKNSNRLA